MPEMRIPLTIRVTDSAAVQDWAEQVVQQIDALAARVAQLETDPTLHREALAAYAHEAWAGWMSYVWAKSTLNADGTVTIPAWAVTRWTRQITTRYTDLPESEKLSDREEADKMLAILQGRA